jgi:PKD repeat protein
MGVIIRSLINPKAYSCPNTYKGQYWESGSWDNGGVHTNCGPLAYWFYLLSEGGSGVNDKGNAYQVEKIGINKAEQIAFKTLTEYLGPSSQYIDAYNYSIVAAGELFGGCSPEVQAVGDAFYAIGVINDPFKATTSANFKASETVFCSIPAKVTFINKSFNGNTYLWDFGDGTTSTETNPVHTYTEKGNYTVTLSVDGGSCGSETITKQKYIKIDESYLCNVIMPNTGTMNKEGCAGVFHSPGWPNNYPNNSHSTLIIHAPGATGIVLTIEEFNIEAGAGSACNYDYVAFYNGNSTGAPLINGTYYCNTTGNPGTISSTGEYITILFHSDVYMNYSGFKIVFQCLGTPTPPKANFIANITTTCLGFVEFTDKSSNEPDEWLWDFGDGETSTEKNPVHQYIENGDYTVNLTVKNEFGTDDILKENYITVEIPEAPEVADIEGCKDEEFEIVLDWEGIAHWYENTTDEEPVYIGNIWTHPPIEENTTYFLREISEAPEGSIEKFCISSFTEVLIIPEICVFIVENHIGNIAVYPNPTSGELIIEMGDMGYGICDIAIFDVMGRKVQSSEFNVQSSILNPKPETLNILHLQNGMYFVRITTENGVITKKVIKQ